LGVLFLGLSFYTYTIMRFYSPLFFLMWLVLFYSEWREQKKVLLFSILIYAAALVPFLLFSYHYNLWGRYYEVSILSSPHIFIDFVKNYFSYFSASFLFLAGDLNERHGVLGVGELYYAMAPFLALGIGGLIRGIIKRKNTFNILRPAQIFLLVWLLVYPVAGSLTSQGVPHAPRGMIGIPILIIFTVLGVGYAVNYVVTKKLLLGYIVLAAMSVLFLAEVINFNYQYFVNYPADVGGITWQYGYRDLYQKMRGYEKNYQNLVFSSLITMNNPILARFYLSDRLDMQFKMLYNVNIRQTPVNFQSLYILSGNDIEYLQDKQISYKVVDTVNNKQDQVIFYLVNFQP
jgi:hypothetical protein